MVRKNDSFKGRDLKMSSHLTMSKVVFLLITSLVALSITAGMLWLIVHYARILAAIAAAPIPSGNSLAVAAAELRSAQRVLESLQAMLAVAAIFSVAFPILLAIVAVLYAGDWVNERIQNHTSSAIEQIKQQLEATIGTAQKKTSAMVYNHLAVGEWRRVHNEKGLNYALNLAKGALQLAEQLPPGEQATRATVKSNLAYYYAELGTVEKRDEALRLSTDAKAFYDQHPEPEWEFLLANSLYTRMRFARNCDVATLQPLLNEMRDVKEDHPNIREELDSYIQELQNKCPGAL